jgi:hypothetical protein
MQQQFSLNTCYSFPSFEMYSSKQIRRFIVFAVIYTKNRVEKLATPDAQDHFMNHEIN